MTPQALHSLLLGEQELALLDVREARAYVGGHLNLARMAPLSSLELELRALVPRLSTTVVLIDDGSETEGPAARAERLLVRMGYVQVELLEGGTAAWTAAGLPLIDGYGTLVKAFGGQVLERHATPTLDGEALRAQQRSARPATLVDARPADEYAYLSLPGAGNHAGTELALREWTADASAAPWVVNCFSRTRGIVGSTTLRLLGHPDARFLEDGVMRWALSGAPVLRNAVPAIELPQAPEAELRRRACTLIDRHALPLLPSNGLPALQADTNRTLYLFDLRPGAADDERSGIRAVPGGQLLMHFENLVGTRKARIVLIDDAHRLRAAVTAFWLIQLGQADVFILDGDPPIARTTGSDGRAAHDAEDAAAQGTGLSPPDLESLLHSASARTQVVDVGPSADYEQRHLPRASFLLPFTLEPLGALLPDADRIVFTSPDGRAARRVARDARERWPARHFGWLRGGTEAWEAAGLPTEAHWAPAQLLTPFEDDWGSVMRVPAERRQRVWSDYLAWERALSERVMRDPTVRFRFFA
ncbi:rhodanese-like domain-containing protein [Variovorax sp. J22P168]|uniref:rhodanese-like domain-containing protein n=1 Tax=Variovorax jilinensis TaxID=3053513 RepID=UPI0025776BEC|nr:rhodanese-like domain-containing protein [Variovorax sp. J22P168]MDM0014688.1 rhodanese-like domain-containing protein [Variovorax sp. J22P168]